MPDAPKTRPLEPPFEVDYRGQRIAVTEHDIKHKRVFYIVFPDLRKPLTLTVGERPGGEKFWTSVPEGRQAEAEEIGKLIANFIRGKIKE